MNKPLSNSARKIQEAFVHKGLPFQVLELSASTRTASDAAKTLGCEIAQIIKSLIFRTQKTQQAILVLASGINRVNEKAIAHEVGEALEKADANFTRDVTGFAIGGIPPFGHAQIITTFIDEDLLQYDELWAAAGTPNAVFNLTSQDLKNLTLGKIISIK